MWSSNASWEGLLECQSYKYSVFLYRLDTIIMDFWKSVFMLNNLPVRNEKLNIILLMLTNINVILIITLDMVNAASEANIDFRRWKKFSSQVNFPGSFEKRNK